MAIYKPGRLYRKLKDLPKPLFEVNTQFIGTREDTSISSIVIHRGKSGPGGGISPSTCEVQFPNYAQAVSGQTMTVALHPAAAAALSAIVGQGADGLAPRFTGRLGQQDVEDLGLTRRTVLTGSSWSAQLANSPQKFSFAGGTSVGELLRTIMQPTHLPEVSPIMTGAYDTIYESVTNETYGELIGRYAEDIGILISDTRAGNSQILPLVYRAEEALAKVPNSTPLTRGQALSPAQWSQPNEGVPQAYRLVRRRADNIIVNADIGEIDGTQPVVDLDWSYFRGHTDQWLYVHALRAQGFEDRYRISKLSIDLLQLLTSDRPLDKQQAGKLLTLEPGDPIFLSGDWPGVFRGIYFAEGITETINSNTWQIDLEISNFRETVGQVSPEIPAKIWDSASYPWQDEFRKWNEA